MEYVKGSPFFCNKIKRIKQYPYLDKDIKTEILIVGGGIDGAIANFYLSQNHEVVLVDKAKLGFGCTSCATALLEYQLDEFAGDLQKEFNEEQIVDIYKMGLYSIDKIAGFISRYGNECDFKLRPTFLYTASKMQKDKIIKEYSFRKKHGFNCDLFDALSNPFPFDIEAGVYAPNGGCEFNPYLFTKQMIDNSRNKNAIYENTKIQSIDKKNGKIFAKTNYGYVIECDKIIIATGFNWELLNKSKLCDRFISYSIVTDPIPNFLYFESALIHDASSPYHYLRTLPDGRIIFGGEDVKWNEKKGIEEKKAEKKFAKLEEDLKNLFRQHKSKIKISNKFCGAFGTTANNMGLIGQSEEKGIYYFISCGANGIINAMYGVELLEDLFKHKPNKYEKIFSPIREI